MNEALDPAQAEPLMNELLAFCRQTKKKQRKAWKEHVDTLPHLRTWLASFARTGRKSLLALLAGGSATRKHAPSIAAKTGVPIGTQILQQLRLYLKHRVPADGYYFLGMYEEQVREKARFFIGDELASVVLHRLATTAPEEEYEPLHNKHAFWNHCSEHDLPTVSVLAIFRNGSLQKDYGEIRGALPPQDLFSKPVTGFLGQGVRTWTYDGDGSYVDEKGRTYAPQSLIETLKRQSTDGTFLLQPRVRDQSRLQELTGGKGPSTLRIVTIRRPAGPPEYFAGFLTTPLEGVPAPTFKGGTALAARVDANSGQLGRPLHKQSAYLLGNREQHPRSGKRMTGFEVPCWDEAKTLALQAHATLPSIACVGWDVMLTDEGPRLLEGNYDCSAVLTQITHQQLLGLTRFPEYLCTYVQHAEG